MKIIYLFLIVVIFSSCSSIMNKVEHWSGAKLEETRPGKKYFRPAWIKKIDPPYETGNLPIVLNSSKIYRGMVFVGHNSGEMQAFSLDNGHLIWKKYDGGEYRSAPIVFDEKIFYGTTRGRVFSRDTLTGKKIFEIDLGAPVESSGVFAKNRLLFHLRNHQIFCLDASTGKILWNYKRNVSQITTLQKVARPTVVSNKVYVGFADGYLVSLSLEEGELLWEKKISLQKKFRDLDAEIYYDGKNLIVAPYDSPLTIVSPKKGQVVNRVNIKLANSPVAIDGDIFGGTLFGELVLFDEYYNIKKKVSISNRALNYIKPWKSGLVASSISGRIYFLDKNTLEVLDEYHFGHKYSTVFESPDVDENHLAVTSGRGRLYVFR